MGEPAVRTLWLTLRREGARSTLQRAWFRFFRVNRFYLFALDVAAAGPDEPLPVGAVFREVSLAELADLRARCGDLPADFFRDEVLGDARCFVVTVADDLAYVVWASSRPVSGFFPLGPGEVEGAYVHCLPRFRGRDIHRLVQPRLARLLGASGIRRLVYAVHDGNPAGIRPLVGSGFEQVGWGFRLGTVTWTRSLHDLRPR